MADDVQKPEDDAEALVLHPTVEAQLDQWRTTQSPALSRLEAVKRLVTRALHVPDIINNPHHNPY